MIRITYAPADEALARRIRADLSHSAIAGQSLLIALASRAALDEASVTDEIKRAEIAGTPILPIITDEVALPAGLAKRNPLDFRAGYDGEKLLARVGQLAGNEHDIRKRNRRLAIAIALLVAAVFGWAVGGITSGAVAFPVAEYNEEATFQAEWIDGLIRETLEYIAPRSAQDAANFAATYEAAPTRLHYYARGTATALANEPDA